jgi:hypothetical protein
VRFDRNRFNDALLGWILSTLVLAGTLVPAYFLRDRDDDLFSSNWLLFGSQDKISFITVFDYVAVAWIVATLYRLCTLIFPAATDHPSRLEMWLYRGSIAFFALGYLNFLYNWLPKISVCKSLPTKGDYVFARTCVGYQAGLFVVCIIAVALLVASLLARARQARRLEGAFE